MATNAGMVWIAREALFGGHPVSTYAVSAEPLLRRSWGDGDVDWYAKDSHTLTVCTDHFHAAFPNIRLKPGEGPEHVLLYAVPEIEGLDMAEVRKALDATVARLTAEVVDDG